MILELLINAGILQFGNFYTRKQWQPYIFYFELLPSYPNILNEIASLISQELKPNRFDFLACPEESLPLGILVSQEIDKPLVYFKVNSPSMGFIGAFDVGHPAMLLSYTEFSSSILDSITQSGSKVGLDFQSAYAVVQSINSNRNKIFQQCLLNFGEAIGKLYKDDVIPQALFKTLQQINHHPNSKEP